jgi:hypothetical protein
VLTVAKQLMSALDCNLRAPDRDAGGITTMIPAEYPHRFSVPASHPDGYVRLPGVSLGSA